MPSVAVWLFFVLAACTPRPHPPQGGDPPPLVQTATALARTPTAAVTLPVATAALAQASDPIAAIGRVEPHAHATDDAGAPYTIWSVALPFDLSLFSARIHGARSFSFYAPEGLEVAVGGHTLRFLRKAAGPYTWGYDETSLLIGLPDTSPAPQTSDLAIFWPHARTADAALRVQGEDIDKDAFVRRSLVQNHTTTTGVFLPPGASATWSLTVPDHGVLVTRPMPVRPPIRHSLQTPLTHAQIRAQDEVLWQGRIDSDMGDLRLDLSRWAGQPLALTLSVSSENAELTAGVLFEEPVVYTPKTHPVHLVLAYIDTVRTDHLGMYGYPRPTTPKLDRWASEAVVLENAHTVSPWTLPSALSALSGNLPDAFDATPNLAERLATLGFYTGGEVANAYLGEVFGANRGFSSYTFTHQATAQETVDRVIAMLQRWPDRDVLVLAQFMEAHMPYVEPAAYRGLFEPTRPESIPDFFFRKHVMRISPQKPSFPAEKAYVLARYDQSIRVLDDEVARLFATAGPDATTVLFSDHGEEFWEHGGIEHGHSLHEELLHVPFVVRSPYLKPARSALPASLLDLTPTLIELAGVRDGVNVHGTSLLPALKGDRAAATALIERPQTFGLLLYGDDAVGVLQHAQKWIAQSSREQVFDLAQDPSEQRPQPLAGPQNGWLDALTEVTGRTAGPVWRLSALASRLPHDLTITFTCPERCDRAWIAYDPRGFYEASSFEVQDGQAILHVPAGTSIPPEAFLRPHLSAEHTAGLVITVDTDAIHTSYKISVDTPFSTDGTPKRIADHIEPIKLTLTHARTVEPAAHTIRASHPDAQEDLKALGYVE